MFSQIHTSASRITSARLVDLPVLPLARHYYKIGRITAKSTSYRIVFDLFSKVCKVSRLVLCRKFILMRHDSSPTRKRKKVQNFLFDTMTPISILLRSSGF